MQETIGPALRPALVLFLALVGCSSSPSEPSVDAPREAKSTASGLEAKPVLAGYRHTVGCSHFALGSDRGEKSEFGLQKVIGEYGVFTTNEVTGMTMGLPNGNSPARARRPLSTTGAPHNAAVRDYFLSCGLPAAQIGKVSEQVILRFGGREGIDVDPPKELEAYFSTIFRMSPNGVSVVDSFAWARINADADVVQESVYWPDIPEEIVSEAEAFSVALAAQDAREKFIMLLPQDLRERAAANGRVLIRHTSGAWRGSFSAYAVFDVGGIGLPAHFDKNARQVILPEELPSGVPATPK
jgi:hypothetical protein